MGFIVRNNASIGDITFEVGFVLSALLYWIFFRISPDKRSEALVIPDEST